MRVCEMLCVGLALSLPLAGCASWHRPDTVYRGRKSTESEVATTPDIPAVDNPIQDLESDQETDAPEFAADDVDRSNDAPAFNPDASTLTPPIQGVSHRTGYRGEPERARPVRKERVAPYAPGLGYIELPPPPDLK